MGYAQLMDADSNLPAHRKRAVGVIRRAGEHLLSLIDGTLDMAQIESGRLRLNVKPMLFDDVVHEIASLFEWQAQAKGLHFACEVSAKLPRVVRADEKRVRQIVINLLGNAIKFTHSGHVLMRVRYAREMAFIEVEDTGVGLSPDELERIFEPFARAAAAAQAVPGAGLGLTIAKMLTDLMGGQMSVSSQPGIGSTFRVKLFLPEVHPPHEAYAVANLGQPRLHSQAGDAAGLLVPSVRQQAIPPRRQLDVLHQQVTLGYYRGIQNALDEIERGNPDCAAFVADMRRLAQQFQFEAMEKVLNAFC